MAFFILGLSSGLLSDLTGHFNSLVLNDLVSFTIFISCLVLAFFNRMQPGTGLVICATETLRNFYVALVLLGFGNPSYTYAHDDIMKILLITCLFATVLGLAVNKTIALVYNVCGVGMQILYVFLFKDDKYFQEQFLVNCMIMSGNLFVIFYYRNMLEHLFADLTNSLETTSKYQAQVETMNEQNRPFVVFGRNTAGLVHDFRNDINGIDLTIQTMNFRHSRGNSPNQQDFEAIERSIANLNRRIEMVKFLTNATPDRELERLDLGQVLESALYPFMISPELRRRLTFDMEVSGNVATWGLRLQYLQIIENLVRNSCEAIISEHGDVPVENLSELIGPQDNWGTVGVRITGDDAQITMVFTDNGPGIAFCKQTAQHHDCMTCNCFAIGKSTKIYGSGYGMVNIIKSVRELGGTLAIKTGDTGTTITVTVPRQEK